MPKDILGKLHTEIVRILKLPDVQKRFQGEGGTVAPDTPEQFAAFIKSEIAKWGKAVKDWARASTDKPLSLAGEVPGEVGADFGYGGLTVRR